MKYEITCQNKDCKHKFPLSRKVKTLKEKAVCPKCGFENLLQDVADKLLLKVLKNNKDERNS